MAVYPANDSALVNQLGEILGADLDVIMSLNNLDGESWVPGLPLPGPEGAGGNGPPDKAQRLSFCLDLKPGVLEARTLRTQGQVAEQAGGRGEGRPPSGPPTPRCRTPSRERGPKTEPGPAAHVLWGRVPQPGAGAPAAAILTDSRSTEGAQPAPCRGQGHPT